MMSDNFYMHKEKTDKFMYMKKSSKGSKSKNELLNNHMMNMKGMMENMG